MRRSLSHAPGAKPGGVAGGLAGAAAAGVGAFGQYAYEGARKASPQAGAQLDYQMDRLQAIVGQSFVPAVESAAKLIERIGNLFGGKGAQLNMPKFSDFSSIRDRLQVDALKGSSGGNPLATQMAVMEALRSPGFFLGEKLGRGQMTALD